MPPDAAPTVNARLPFLLPWLRLQIFIREIRATTWDSATWPTRRETLRDALQMQAAMRRRRGWWD